MALAGLRGTNLIGKSFVIFSAQYPPHMGGLEAFTQRIAHCLAGQGHQVLVVTNDTEGLENGLIRENDIEVMRLPCFPFISGRFPVPRFNELRRDLLRDLRFRHIDGVLVNTRFYTHSLLGMKLARSKGLVPVVLDHGSAWLSFSNPILDPLVRLYERAFTYYGKLRYRPDYYGISKKSSEWLTTFGIQGKGEICNSIDAADFRALSSGRDYRNELNLTSDAFVVAFVGRLIPEKGVSQLIEASKAQSLRERNVVFLIAGDGPLAGDVDAAQGKSLRWLGSLSKPDVSALLQQADVMCLPTRSEGFSTTLLEASACGCPSIVTDVGGARELIPDASYGTIIGSMSASDISKAVIQLADVPGRANAQGNNSIQWVEETVSWENSAKHLIAAFCKAAELH